MRLQQNIAEVWSYLSLAIWMSDTLQFVDSLNTTTLNSQHESITAHIHGCDKLKEALIKSRGRFSVARGARRQRKVSHPSRAARPGTPPWGGAEWNPRISGIPDFSPRSGRQPIHRQVTCGVYSIGSPTLSANWMGTRLPALPAEVPLNRLLPVAPKRAKICAKTWKQLIAPRGQWPTRSPESKTTIWSALTCQSFGIRRPVAAAGLRLESNITVTLPRSCYSVAG